MGFIVLLFVTLVITQAYAENAPSNGEQKTSFQKGSQCNCTCKDGKDGRDGKDGVVTAKQFKELIKAIGDLQEKVRILEKRNPEKSLKNVFALLLRNRRFRAMLMKKMRRPRGFLDADFDPVKLFFGESFNLYSHITQPPPTKAPATYPDILGGVKDNTPQLNNKGKIPQKLLPSGYDKLSAADIQWQALHMAAAASCRSIKNKPGFPGIHNTVLLRNAAEGKSCRTLCSQSWARRCQGEVSIWGKAGKGTKNGEEVGNYLNFGCDLGFNGGSEAYASDEDVSKELRSEHQHLYSYCCCSFY